MSVVQVFQVNGLHCQSCVGAVKDALGELPGVSGVDVELNPEGASQVRVDSDVELAAAQVQSALLEEGEYTLAS